VWATKDFFDSLGSIGNIDLVDVVELRPGGDRESGRGHSEVVSFNKETVLMSRLTTSG
jgi:hypothetical protein